MWPRQDGEGDARQHPEHAIFDATNHPDPFLGHLPGGRAGNEQMGRGDHRHIGGVNGEDQSDGQERLDRARDIHPGGRRIELGGLEKIQRRRLGEFADNMRNEEQPAD